MEKRTIGGTNLELSVITFGAWAAGGWMWGGTDQKEAEAAIKASIDLGVTSIDTAPIYGMGLSEEIVGSSIRGYPREKLQILTKYGMLWDRKDGQFYFKSVDNSGKAVDIHKFSGKESVINECEQSLKRLGTDYIDLYQIHWPDPTTPPAETMEAVLRLKEQGKIREAGVCNYSVELMKEAEAVLALASNQMPYSMVKRDIEGDVVPYCKKKGKGILAYSPLQRGLLTGKMRPGQKFPEGDHRAAQHFFSDENIDRTNRFLNDIKPIADEKGATLAQLVLRWTVDQPGITIALAGARNRDQAQQNAKAGSLSLNSEEIGRINSKLEALDLVPA